MWKKIGYQPVGGMREAGFIETTDYLMVLGSQGRTILNCLTNKKIERDRQDYYLENWNSDTGIIEGIGIFKDKEIICGGFEYPDNLPKSTNDSWIIHIQDENRINYKGNLKVAKVMYMFNQRFDTKIEVNVFHYSITRAYGFSPTGKTFVIAEPEGITIWIRNG